MDENGKYWALARTRRTHAKTSPYISLEYVQINIL
jgi:hypothetical protein